jgi:hypothetical protein
VAAGIEAIASIGDPAALEDLARLEGDDRVVDVGDLDEGGSVTIGELVEAAIEEIEPRESR